MARLTLLSTGALLLHSIAAQSSSACSASLTASYPAPSLASGYQAQLVANRLRRPRSIIFDSEGNLLVVEAGRGITGLTFQESGNGCLSVSATKAIINDTSVSDVSSHWILLPLLTVKS